MDSVIHLIYGSDDNYWFPTAVSAASASHGCSQPLTIHLFDAGVSDEHYEEYVRLIHKANPSVVCERNVLDKAMFAGFGEWRGSVVTYSRMFIQDILPDLDWAIYVDGDTLWLGDVAKLWALRDETKLIQASKDPPMPLNAKHPDDDWYKDNGIEMTRDGYVCMGLMMPNLKKMREMRISEKVRDFMAKYPQPKIVDQTVLNYICRGMTAELPTEWGVFSAWHGTADLTKDGCVHYVNDLPWKRDKINRLMSDVVLLWYEFAETVLDLPLKNRYISTTQRLIRRTLFCVCKHLQFMIRRNQFVQSRLRNTHGLNKREKLAISKRWNKES